ncbi:MAG: sigma-70 family RNA polymerase sigma factor [Planctomycetaceae bacterium]
MAEPPTSLDTVGISAAVVDIEGDVARLRTVGAGDLVHQEALARLFSVYRERLLRMVEFRLSPKVRARIDPWDVLQESFLDASQRIESFQTFRGSFFKWIRLIVLQRIDWLHRHHLGTQKRDAYLDVSLERALSPEDNNRLAEQLAASLTSPSQAVRRAELIQVVNQILLGLKPIDREVLVLRHFEHLGNTEVAEVLEITPVAASVR